MLVTPFVATMLIYFWIGQMTMIQGPGSMLSFLVIATVAVTAILAAIEASMVGMKSDSGRGTYSPISWFFIISLLWVVGYPAYLFKRRHYGLKNYLFGSLVIMAVFVGMAFLMQTSIESQSAAIQHQLLQLQQSLK